MKDGLLRLGVAGFCIAIGLLFPVMGVIDHQRGQASESWPNVQGEVISERHRLRKNRYSIFYAYEVDGVRYENSRVNFQNDKASKKEMVERYDKGARLPVYYDPQDPDESVLVPGAKASGLAIRIVAGLFCLGLGLFFWRALKPKPTA